MRTDKQFKSVFVLQSLGNCDGAVLNKNKTGDATNSDVTSNVAVVNAILCIVADVRSQTQGTQHIHPAESFKTRKYKNKTLKIFQFKHIIKSIITILCIITS